MELSIIYIKCIYDRGCHLFLMIIKKRWRLHWLHVQHGSQNMLINPRGFVVHSHPLMYNIEARHLGLRRIHFALCVFCRRQMSMDGWGSGMTVSGHWSAICMISARPRSIMLEPKSSLSSSLSPVSQVLLWSPWAAVESSVTANPPVMSYKLPVSPS